MHELQRLNNGKWESSIIVVGEMNERGKGGCMGGMDHKLHKEGPHKFKLFARCWLCLYHLNVAGLVATS